MTKCDYCGREIPDEATSCECGSVFSVLEKSRSISTREKSLWCAGAWIVAIIALAVIGGPSSPLVCLACFPVVSPVGCLVLLLLAQLAPIGQVFAFGFGWWFYVWLTRWTLKLKRRRFFFAFYAILCMSLAFNLVGCEGLSTGVLTSCFDMAGATRGLYLRPVPETRHLSGRSGRMLAFGLNFVP